MQLDLFEWDEAKAEYNFAKHGVSFAKAIEVFYDPLARTFPDPDHSIGEEREITFGEVSFGEVLIVSHTTRGERIRIISARHATKAERRRFMSDTHIIRDKEMEKDDLRPEYDFDLGPGVVGKYYQGRRYVIHVTLDDDVSNYFATAKSVNDALRQLIAEGRTPTRKE